MGASKINGLTKECLLGSALILLSVALAASSLASAADSGTDTDLSQLTLEQLANMEVTSVTKVPQSLQQAPAAIYVITHDDIARSGVTSISEALRLAPNLSIFQESASAYVASARGLAGNPPDQSFSNKLLILIDGRSVYSPLFSGVYLDAQDVLLEDVDRIEVISGPGATLWGANAMNGVINIITRPAYLSDGALVSAGAGNLEQDVGARYGARIDDETAFRVYAKSFYRDALEKPDKSSAHDEWYRTQGGFRIDRSLAQDTLTLQGDIYRSLENDGDQGSGQLSGANLLTRWKHHSTLTETQVQAYFDQSESFAPYGGTAFVLHTWDIEFQQMLAGSGRQQIVWGAGERLYSYAITNTPTFLFSPDSRNLTLGNLFGQDTVALGHRVKLTLGTKLEHDPYAGWQFQPDLRLAWAFTDQHQLWAAASRAVRAPTPFDIDVIEKLGTIVYLTGNSAFKPERMRAYEVGYRGTPSAALSLSASFFYNRYADLRSVEPAASGLLLPFYWGNGLDGYIYGADAWAQWQVTSWWRLSPGLRTAHEGLHFTPGTIALLGSDQNGNDPGVQAVLGSSMDLGPKTTLDLTLRHVGALPEPALAAYTELNARVGLRATQTLELSLSGFNLLHARHYETPAPYGEAIPRSFMIHLEWRP